MRNRAIVYGEREPAPTFKVTSIDASIIATQERDRLQPARTNNVQAALRGHARV